MKDLSKIRTIDQIEQEQIRLERLSRKQWRAIEKDTHRIQADLRETFSFVGVVREIFSFFSPTQILLRRILRRKR